LSKYLWLLLFGIALLGSAVILSTVKQGVQNGDTITADYVLTLDDGTVYASSQDNEPLKAALGQGKLLPGFEEEVIGMQVGDTKTFTLPPEQAYGSYRADLVGTVSRSMLPEGMEPEIGKQLQTELKDGTQTLAVIMSFTDTTVTVNANHPLAGQTLTFRIKLLEINKAPPLKTGYSPVYSSWIILILGVSVICFVLFYSNKPGKSVVRKSARPRAMH
jgi:peptidylprolyl isomerase